ncbi:ferredoxin--nitrite reductase [Halovenus sp. WSH3]|uniref:Ferredoxin--nitrite reductase n=1 Tax=Halovenus carboxidivorans TaxID=2692199 RepID=A0A6B0SYM9_9EURY|nr:rhodanese-like domain-containing protein [Halovenus carboxidivorans]MXR50684.1 ferredoxin--nitrite reductase [Halovenus carboxidivorans]
MSDVSVVGPAWLDDHRDEVAVVDVRDENSYESVGHVPGAVNVPYEAIRDPTSGTAGHLPTPAEFAGLCAEAGIDEETPIVAYDDGPGVYAARLLLTAAALGHEGELYLLDGGYDDWSDSYETETGPVEGDEAASYDADEPGSPVVGRERVETAVDEDETVLVDTRSAAEYDSAHIPGAVQLGWEDLVADGSLKDREEIRRMLADRGLDADREIVLYCNTARRLSHTYAVLSELGYESVYAYEGSLTDWIREESDDWSPEGLEQQVREYADEGFEALVDAHGDGVLDRLKLIGLYHQKQRGYFMLRTKVPGGNLTAEQARVIGEVADEFATAPEEYGGAEQNAEFGDAYLDITDRQDIQMHWIELEDVPEIWDRYDEVGLTTMQACGNSVRNVVACPVSGLDPEEELDAQSVADRVTERFLGDEHYANLPRKFKVSVTGCHENCARAEINDLGLLPARKDGRVGFNAKIGGGLSDGPRIARDLDLFVEPDQVVDLVEAAADFFIDHGSYLDTAVNRLRFLVAEMGVETVREEIEARASFEFESAGEGLTERYRGDHVGVHEQADGNRYVGLNVPVGRMGGAEFARLADLAEQYGNGEVRVTLNQNAVLPGVAPDEVEQLREDPVVKRYSPDPGPFTRGVLACTGKEYCTYGIINTKNRAVRWARELDEWYEQEYDGPADPDAIRMHLSGCSASCAQPQIADIGLRGEDRRTIEGSEPAVDVGLGGDLGRERFIDWIVGSHPTADLPDAVRRVLDAYAADTEDEPFSVWVEQTPRERLFDLVTDRAESTATPTEADD